jgi:hypothetical protein
LLVQEEKFNSNNKEESVNYIKLENVLPQGRRGRRKGEGREGTNVGKLWLT